MLLIILIYNLGQYNPRDCHKNLLKSNTQTLRCSTISNSVYYRAKHNIKMRCRDGMQTKMTVNFYKGQCKLSWVTLTKLRAHLATYMRYSNIQNLTTQEKLILYYFPEISDSVSLFCCSATCNNHYIQYWFVPIRPFAAKDTQKSNKSNT